MGDQIETGKLSYGVAARFDRLMASRTPAAATGFPRVSEIGTPIEYVTESLTLGAGGGGGEEEWHPASSTTASASQLSLCTLTHPSGFAMRGHGLTKRA